LIEHRQNISEGISHYNRNTDREFEGFTDPLPTRCFEALKGGAKLGYEKVNLWTYFRVKHKFGIGIDHGKAGSIECTPEKFVTKRKLVEGQTFI